MDAQKIYAVVFEDPNDYIPESDDIRRELLGVFTTLELAQKLLDDVKIGNPYAELYSIEEWDDTVYF